MKSREDIIEILTRNLPDLEKQYKVNRIGLFGSYARNEQNDHSDVDLLVEVDPSIGLDFVTLAEKIENLLGEPVDLVSSRAVNKRYREVIEQELIYV